MNSDPPTQRRTRWRGTQDDREVHIEIDGWENWNDLLRYVIRPLSDQGYPPEVRITIRAESDEGIPAKLLQDQIEVSLQQLGIQYKLDNEPL